MSKELVEMTAEEMAEYEAFRQDKAKKAEAARIKQERETYKEMKDATIRTNFELLCQISEGIMMAKKTVFGNMETLIDMKDELYKTKSDRQSDTFSTEDGEISIKLGNRINEGWADTVDIGIQKVKDHLKTLAKDENSANLVETVMNLLAKDRKGNLKANKVLELERLAVKSGDENFIDGINIIKEAYRPAPSCQFIEVRFKDDEGKERSLPLSMSAIDNS
ncbi:DUF3164 family protein [Dysgonomonas sp. 521]|uniref:DUF3164 family protein n=1 Tax=Dysgonomonas sp. 521 TaxID=2302932 RepID=UPI0013D1CFF3|nr:DUF3164 family protein [Dysgonomonas sp. 521]NDV97647.1 DUF3164 family protein [Dysgonomonas sp. 521]NDV97653.1 DUF3164 family protein [Dysgonomonas sp. 521]